MLFQVYPDCQTLYHRLFLSQSRQALESVRWDLQSQVKVRGGSYNIKQNCQHLLVKSETEILSSYPYFIIRVNFFREYDDYEIGSEEWHYHYHFVNCIFFTNKQIVFFSHLFHRSFLQYNIRNKNKPSPIPCLQCIAIPDLALH